MKSERSAAVWLPDGGPLAGRRLTADLKKKPAGERYRQAPSHRPHEPPSGGKVCAPGWPAFSLYSRTAIEKGRTCHVEILETRRGHVALAAAVGLWCSSPSLAARPGGGGSTGPSYQIVELDSAGGTLEGYPFDINNAGLIVGGVSGSAACWTVNKANGTVTSTLHLLDGELATGVNGSGEIVGSRNDTAAYWESPNAAHRALPVPLGSTRSIAKRSTATA